jgi:phage-related minor tail protein
MDKALQGAAGTALEVARIMDDNLNGALLRVAAAWEGLTLKLGDAGPTNAAKNAFDSLAVVLRLLANNADTIIPILEGIALLLTLKFIPAVLASGAALKLLTNPGPIIALGVAVFATNLVFREMNAILKEIEETNKNIASEAMFSGLGAQISGAQRELNKLEDVLDKQRKKGFGPSQAQLDRIDQLRERIVRVTGDIRKQADAQRELNALREAAKPSVENTLKALDRKLILLQKLNRESEIEVAFEAEINKLLAAGIVPDQRAKAQIERRLGVIQALKDQKRILEDIRGPQEQFARDQHALEALQRRGTITAEEYRNKLAELKGELEVEAVDPFKSQIASLKEANDLLELRINAGDLAADVRAIENDLVREGVVINEDITAEILEQLLRKRGLLAIQTGINAKEQEALDLQSQKTREADREQSRIESLARRINLTDQLTEANNRLVEAERQGLINSEQLATAQEDLKLRGLEASNELGAGFERAFIKIKQEAEDLAAVGEALVEVFAESATDALTEFVTTGELNFKEFTNSILQDISRILARLLVMQALSAAFGLGGGGGAPLAGLGAGTNIGFQDGGTTQPGRSFVVGENGPEIFTPGRTGAVTPNSAAAVAEPIAQIIQITNVLDPSMVAETIMSDPAARDAVINVIGANSKKIRRSLG